MMIFDPAQLTDLLQSEHSHFRKIASESLIDHFEQHNPLFFDYLFNEKTGELLTDLAVRRFIFLNRGFGKTTPFNDSKRYQEFSELADSFRFFLKKTEEYLNQQKDENVRKERLQELCIRFPGISNDLQERYPEAHITPPTEQEAERQLMVFITERCNLSCAYCFSAAHQPREMPLADFKTILKWAGLNNIKNITLCGGEPTLHRNFDNILQMMAENNVKTYFASNLTIDCRPFNYFHPGVIRMIFVHITDAILKDPLLKKRVFENIRWAKEQEIELIFRTNISQTPPPVDEWFHLMDETGIRTLNTALTFPAREGKNEYVSLNAFEEQIETIRSIAERAYSNNIRFSFSKPVPLCLFDRTTQYHLMANQQIQSLCGVHYHRFTHNVCIHPNLKMHSCLGVTEQHILFREELPIAEIESFCSRNIRPLLQKPLYDKCLNCFLFDRALCQGSCLSYKNRL